MKPWRFYFLYFLTGQVDIPKMVYKGQKLTKLVRVNTPAKTSKTIPNVPLTTLVKKRITKMTEMVNLIILSAVFMFFFIIVEFKG